MLENLKQVLRTTGYRLTSYSFVGDNAKERFEQATVRRSGSVILRDLESIARGTGANIPLKISPRSKYDPEMLEKPLIRYFNRPDPSYDGKLLHKAIRKVSRSMYLGNLHARPLEKVTYKPSTNAGAPTFDKKGEVYPDELERSRRIRRGEAPPPCAIFHRGKNEDEVRPVFAYPMSMTLLESRFFEPYQYEVMYHHNPYVGGRTYPQLAGEVNELMWKSKYYMELDYSGFDGSISAKLIHAAFDIIKESFVMSAQDEEDWKTIVRYFVTTPVILPCGTLIVGKRHGVPSGSMFTQLVDSIVNMICIEYWRLSTNTGVSRYHVLGDDSIIGINDAKPNLLEVAKVIHQLGVEVNITKSKVRTVGKSEPYFLGHYWHQMRPTRDLEETWEKVLTPEKTQREFFAKDRKIRNYAYIDRLRAYQDDNSDPETWRQLQYVIDMLQGFRLRQTRFDHDAYRFRTSKALKEREWDYSLKWLFDRPPGGASRHLYVF